MLVSSLSRSGWQSSQTVYFRFPSEPELISLLHTILENDIHHVWITGLVIHCLSSIISCSMVGLLGTAFG